MPNIENCLKYLNDSLVRNVASEPLVRQTKLVLIDKQFISCTAAKTQHQAYEGGLVVHTAEVMDAALRMAQSSHLKVNLEILVPAVIWHDYGKIYDYTCKNYPGSVNIDGVISLVLVQEYEYTEHRSLIRHLSKSYGMFMKSLLGLIDQNLLDAIGHCILSHHGRKEWGSPVEPQTTEAHILHYADMLSAFCAEKEYEFKC